MTKYDSSIETKKHIVTIGKYIDIVCEKLNIATRYNDEIKSATIVDLLVCLSFGRELPFTDDILTSISNNSREYITIGKSSQLQAAKDMINALQSRAKLHDQTKLEEPEKSHFDLWTPSLASSTYENEEYKQMRLVNLKEALDHHYAHNRHHPEHFPNGISDMNIIDFTEMFCDWTASTERHTNGNIYKSINANKERFKYTADISTIFTNTVNKDFGIISRR